MLIDSNIIVDAAKPEHEALREFIVEHAPSVSAISLVEVLGYHRLTESERQHFEAFFAAAPVLPLSQAVLDQAVKLRQLRSSRSAIRAASAFPKYWSTRRGWARKWKSTCSRTRL